MIHLEICSGTACYVMGGGALLLLAEELPADLAGQVLVTGSPCLELCRNPLGDRKAPFVKINGRIHSSATVESVIEALREARDED
ncbi:MAG: hypothetical protein JXK93_07555 [Sphaerochaetaceae bacterium]|nr:hypothetical protein [Sphaerochaetaceae bacterium]